MTKMCPMRFVDSKIPRKRIKNRVTIIRHSMRASLLIALGLRIVFFPFFFLRWYIHFLINKPFKFLIFNLCCVTAVVLYLLVCYLQLPSIDKIYNYKPILTSKFYDANDELIYEVGAERRTHVDIDKIPKMLIYAFISAEDKTFYTNVGFDPVGLARTAMVDFVKILRHQKLAGASTITQQVVKNVLLSNERTISRKIKEIILSYRISKALSKDAIMEIYLNHIYLGMQAYGIVSASEEYFGKTLSQLTIPEMALLAAMPKAPSSINPFKNYNRAVARRNWVLLRMFEDGYISQDQYEQYSRTELIVRKRHNMYSPFYAPSFFARSLLLSKGTGLNKDDLLSVGYKVKLTIDGELQRIAQEALNHSLEDYSKKHGFTGPIFAFSEEDLKTKTSGEMLRAVDEPENLNRFLLAVVLKVENDKATIGLRDNSVGKILLNDMLWARQKISETEISDRKITKCSDVLRAGDVVVVDRKGENGDYYSLEQLPQINGGVLAVNPKTGAILSMVGGYADLAGSFNRTVQAFRQMGSVIKPFIYGVALANGYTPASIFMDADVSINIGNGVVWEPNNDNKRTSGPTTLRIGLERSRNTVTIRIADAIGLKKVRKIIINAGLNDKPEKNLAVALGSVESSLVNIATAYSAFANNGVMPKLHLISSVKNIVDSENEFLDGEDGGKNILNKMYFKNCDLNAQCNIEFEEKNSEKNVKYPQTSYENNEEQEAKEETNEDEDGYKKNNVGKNKDGGKLFSPEVAYQIANILQGAVKRGTSRKLSGLNLPIASKTGTSNQGKDLWSVVISPELLLVAYVGYDIPMETNNYGAQYALPINREILANLPEKYKISDFQTPEGIKFVKINRLTGKKATQNDENTIFEAFKQDDEIDDKIATEGDNLDDEQENIDITQIE